MLRKGIHGSEPPKAKTHRFLRQLDENGFPQFQDFGLKTASVDDFNVESQIKRGALGKTSVRLSSNTPVGASDSFEASFGGLPAPEPAPAPAPEPAPAPAPEPAPAPAPESAN